MIKMYIEKTVLSLKANAIFAYPAHVVVLNFT